MKISNSQKDKYQSCPRKWFYHYKEKLRSPKVFSSLFFGNALDDAFSRMLLDKKKEHSPEEIPGLKLTPQEIFSAKMLECKNDAGNIVQIAQSNLADYYSSDFDESLFTPEIVAMVSKLDKNINTIQKIVAFHSHCKTNLNPKNKNKKRLTDDEYILYNYLNWLSLNEKGKLMLDAYKEQIIPHISEVFSIQKEISLKNEMGDEITGKIDFIASFIDKPDTKVICDNKTASKAYTADSVKESEQLGTYSEAESIPDCAYVVVQKSVFKKAPFIRTQIIKDVVSEETLQKTFDIYANVCDNISAAGDDKENYPQNWNSCFEYGKICPYYQLCKYNENRNLISCKPKEEGEK